MGSFRNNQERGAGPPPGSQKGPWRGPTLGRAGHPPGCPRWPPDAPFAYITPSGWKALNENSFRGNLSVLPPPPFFRSELLEKLLRHPAGRRSPLRETIHSHGRLPYVP